MYESVKQYLADEIHILKSDEKMGLFVLGFINNILYIKKIKMQNI